MTKINSKSSACLIYLKLSPEHIVLLKFILEGYEELAILRTLDSDKAEVVVLALSDTETTVREIIRDISKHIYIEEIPEPKNLEGDWLLCGDGG
jgi:hypothetical protein